MASLNQKFENHHESISTTITEQNPHGPATPTQLIAHSPLAVGILLTFTSSFPCHSGATPHTPARPTSFNARPPYFFAGASTQLPQDQFNAPLVHQPPLTLKPPKIFLLPFDGSNALD
ncbi:hypothetical protein Scep_029694 [Stephania cephalantha]|uniref:Uncharacterized protein n=1 Tax=Stephania cephalantha TaxID=152367 RepID=A0AAP0E1I9_9MAGN